MATCTALVLTLVIGMALGDPELLPNFQLCQSGAACFGSNTAQCLNSGICDFLVAYRNVYDDSMLMYMPELHVSGVLPVINGTGFVSVGLALQKAKSPPYISYECVLTEDKGNKTLEGFLSYYDENGSYNKEKARTPVPLRYKQITADNVPYCVFYIAMTVTRGSEVYQPYLDKYYINLASGNITKDAEIVPAGITQEFSDTKTVLSDVQLMPYFNKCSEGGCYGGLNIEVCANEGNCDLLVAYENVDDESMGMLMPELYVSGVISGDKGTGFVAVGLALQGWGKQWPYISYECVKAANGSVVGYLSYYHKNQVYDQSLRTAVPLKGSGYNTTNKVVSCEFYPDMTIEMSGETYQPWYDEYYLNLASGVLQAGSNDDIDYEHMTYYIYSKKQVYLSGSGQLAVTLQTVLLLLAASFLSSKLF